MTLPSKMTMECCALCFICLKPYELFWLGGLRRALRCRPEGVVLATFQLFRNAQRGAWRRCGPRERLRLTFLSFFLLVRKNFKTLGKTFGKTFGKVKTFGKT